MKENKNTQETEGTTETALKDNSIIYTQAITKHNAEIKKMRQE